METTLACEQCGKVSGRKFWHLTDDNYEAPLHIKCAKILNDSGFLTVTRITEE